jgi:hypothetical protein
MKTIVLDGIRYLRHDYVDEAELESRFWPQAQVMFGPDAVLIPKAKVRTPGAVAAIPDGFVVDVARRIWYIVEVELAQHDLFAHIVPQVSKFASASESSATRKWLTESFYDVLASEPRAMSYARGAGSADMHKLVSDIVEDRKPVLVIVIDKRTQVLDDVSRQLPSTPRVVEFETFDRENTKGTVWLSCFEALVEPPATGATQAEPQHSSTDTYPVSSLSMPATSKASHVTLGELASAGLVSDGQTVYLCDGRKQKVGGESAKLVVLADKLRWTDGEEHKFTPLALALLRKYRKVGAAQKSIQGPRYWVTEGRKTLVDLYDEYRRLRGL